MIHKGLTNEQVEESRKKHGSNILTPPEKESLWHQFIEKFKEIKYGKKCIPRDHRGHPWSR